MAGAEGFEPSPSALTVRCPTGWTTPQQTEMTGLSYYALGVQRPFVPEMHQAGLTNPNLRSLS
jgi:hypothetical protein